MSIKKIWKAAATTSLCMVSLYFGLVIWISSQYPDHFFLTAGTRLELPEDTAVTAEAVDPLTVSTLAETSYDVELKLLGIIPVKTVEVQVVGPEKVSPCGLAFGVKMHTKGVLVVGLTDVDSAGGPVNPARTAGIQTGDILLWINGKEVNSNLEVAKLVESSGGKQMSLHMKRKNLEFDVILTPALSAAENKYKTGMWIRDSSAGIGTLTLYQPSTKVVAGLGHAICDVDTGEILPISSGEMVWANITGVIKGQAGAPGELMGEFTHKRIGKVLINCEAGIYGIAENPPVTTKSIPVAMRQEVRTGSATILCTVDGTQPKEYDIVIEKVNLSDNTTTKNMVIRVTDPELLEITGGIVQGMSGSPILQDGKLVGAVTHVFVNQPARGYGIFAENMMDFAEKIAG